MLLVFRHVPENIQEQSAAKAWLHSSSRVRDTTEADAGQTALGLSIDLSAETQARRARALFHYVFIHTNAQLKHVLNPVCTHNKYSINTNVALNLVDLMQKLETFGHHCQCATTINIVSRQSQSYIIASAVATANFARQRPVAQ
jgi:hypothetical protein